MDRSDGEDSEASFKTRSGESFKWAEDSDLSDEDEEDDDFRDAEAQPLAAALPVSTLPADPSFFEPSENERAATEPSNAESTAVGPSALAAVLPTESLPDAQPNQTPENQASPADHGTDVLAAVLPTESLPDAQPNQTAENQAFPADHQPDGVLDSQGFIKPPVVVIHDLSQPSDSSVSKSLVPVRVPRLTRRTFAVAPTALEAAALRKKNHPFVSGESQTPAASSTPMETTVDLKRKAQAQVDAPPEEEKRKRREKKKGRK